MFFFTNDQYENILLNGGTEKEKLSRLPSMWAITAVSVANARDQIRCFVLFREQTRAGAETLLRRRPEWRGLAQDCLVGGTLGQHQRS
jgi:hypothetical protein